MQAPFSQGQARTITPEGTRRPLRRPPSALPQRLFSTPLQRAPRTVPRFRAGSETPRARAGQENPKVLALSQQLEQLTEVVKSLVSNAKSKSELPQASVPVLPAREQSFNEHVLLTPQIGRSGGTDFMKRVNNIEQTSRRTFSTFHRKKEVEQLLHIQNEYRSSIPKLSLEKDTGAANFRQWNTSFLAYLEVLHPDLHSVCKTVSGMDFTAETSGQPVHLPPMPAAPDLTILRATSAIRNTCSAEYQHLIGTCGPHDLLPAYSALVQKFSPNSDIHRSSLLAGFWTRNILNHEDIDQYAAELVKISNEINSKMGTEHIKTIDLISNLKRGLLANADRSDDYKTALQNLDFHSCNQLPQLLLHLKKHCRETPSAKPLHAHVARYRGGGGGRGRGGRGRGRGGRGALTRVERDSDGRPTWGASYKDTYIVSKDQDGNTLVGKASKITRFCKEALCFTLLQEGKCDDPECKYRHEFNVATPSSAAPNSHSRATLVLPQPDSANTATTQPQQSSQQPVPVPSAPPPSAPGGPTSEENAAHAFAAIATNDGYPRYIGAEYIPRGYVAIFDTNPTASKKIQVDTTTTTQEQANCSSNEQANCSTKEHANCSKDSGEPRSEKSGCGQEQANCSNKEQANCSTNEQANCSTEEQANCSIKEQANCSTEEQANCSTIIFQALTLVTFLAAFYLAAPFAIDLASLVVDWVHQPYVYGAFLLTPWVLLLMSAYNRPLLQPQTLRRCRRSLRRRPFWKHRNRVNILAFAACHRAPAPRPKFPIIEDSGANRNMSPDKGLFVGPLIPLAQEVRTAEGVSTGVTASGTIQLDGQLLPCLYVPSFKQTMLAKSYFIRSGYTCNTTSNGRITYKHPDTLVRFDFQLSDDDDLFHYISSKPTCLNSL